MELIQTEVSELNCIQIIHEHFASVRERDCASSTVFLEVSTFL